MILQKSTIVFLQKLGEKYNCSVDEALSVLTGKNYYMPPVEIENGVIITLNAPQLSSTFDDFILDKKSISFLDQEPSSKTLSPDEIDISDLHELTQLFFKSIEDVESQTEQYSFKSNLKLNELRIQGYNVKSLDLKNNADLVLLNCSGNKLTKLDLSENINLEDLSCNDNNITQLDLSRNKKLKYVFINDLPLNQDDIQFPEVNNIEKLYIAGTNIESIDLSKFTNLQRLQIGESIKSINVTVCKNLRQLSIFRTKLKHLDISECLDLWSLHGMIDVEIEELVCNEFQSFIIPEISKKLKQKASLAQQKIIKTYELHTKALSHNWDEGYSKLKRILKNENCDKATATAIFWYGQPNYYRQFNKVSEVPDHAKEGFRFLNQLEKKLINNSFSINYISYDPKNHDNIDWTIEVLDPSKVKREISEQLKTKIIGTTKEFDFTKKTTLKYS